MAKKKNKNNPRAGRHLKGIVEVGQTILLGGDGHPVTSISEAKKRGHDHLLGRH